MASETTPSEGRKERPRKDPTWRIVAVFLTSNRSLAISKGKETKTDILRDDEAGVLRWGHSRSKVRFGKSAGVLHRRKR